jgi:aryl-alcohol dehydrogenase-like predicted oxidoreductase
MNIVPAINSITRRSVQPFVTRAAIRTRNLLTARIRRRPWRRARRRLEDPRPRRPGARQGHGIRRVSELAGYAAERGLAMSDVAIGALTAHPRIASVIAGATRPEQVRANARAARWTPGREDLAALDEIFPPAAPRALTPPRGAS